MTEPRLKEMYWDSGPLIRDMQEAWNLIKPFRSGVIAKMPEWNKGFRVVSADLKTGPACGYLVLVTLVDDNGRLVYINHPELLTIVDES